MGSPPSVAGRRARASKPCVPPGSTPAASTSNGGSASNCRCSCGRMCPTFPWENIGNPPPIGRICSTCCPAAFRCFGVFAVPESDLTAPRAGGQLETGVILKSREYMQAHCVPRLSLSRKLKEPIKASTPSGIGEVSGEKPLYDSKQGGNQDGRKGLLNQR